MMAWIQSHQELGAHPKTKKMARILNVSRVTAVGHLQFLWWWATNYAPDGDVTRFDHMDIATGAEWEGDESAFVEALVTAGFLDRDIDGTLCIHDWQDYAGKLIDRRRTNAERMRSARAAHTPADDTPDKERAAHVQRTNDARVELEKRREEESREEKKTLTPPLSPPEKPDGPKAAEPAPKKVTPTPKSVPSRVPEEFEITEAMWEFTVKAGFTEVAFVVGETEKFLDHFRAKGEKKSDWVAAWRNWLRRASEFVPRNTGPRSMPTRTDRAQSDIDKFLAISGGNQ